MDALNLLYGYLPQLISGAWITLQIAVVALLIGITLGLLCTLGLRSSTRLIAYPIAALTTLIRGVPELLVIFFIYFGGTTALSEQAGRYIELSPFWAGSLALGLIFACYATLVLHSALNAIAQTQIDAALALDFSKSQTLLRIILPQAWRHALPGLSNLWLVLMKDTALVSLIGLNDLMSGAQLAASATHAPVLFYSAVAIFYLIMTYISGYGVARLQSRANQHLGHHA